MRFLLSFCVLIVLSSCDLVDRGGQTLIVTDEKIRLAAPAGFCADVQSSTIGRNDAFVVYGNCGALAGDPDAPPPSVMSLVTVAVTTTQTSTAPEQLSAFFKSDAGRAVLGRDGADDINLANSFVRNGVLYLRVIDRSENGLEGLADSYWRAYVQKPGALLAVTVLEFESSPIKAQDGLQIANAFGSRLGKLSGGVASSSSNDSLIGRLFN